MNFAEAARNESHWTKTENGAVAKNTSGDACVDFFGTIGALRNADENRIYTLFEEAYKENPEYAIKILFYARDVREGLGEREVFRKLINYCAKNYPKAMIDNIKYIGEYGRFDDWYVLIDTPLEEEMWKAMSMAFECDRKSMEAGKPISLLAKWIKTPDASSKNTRKLGIQTAINLGYRVKVFKKLLRRMRKYLDITEVKMSANQWSDINYPNVPSRSMLLHKDAFIRHDEDRFNKYIDSVKSGEVKINSATLYPYDLLEKIFRFTWGNASIIDNEVVQAQWEALPNYVEPGTNAIVMADTSGSMQGRPIYTALSLAIYFAERNTGAYHNLFMSFSREATIHELKGRTLAQKLESIDMSDWEMNTNLESAFNKVLDIAIQNNVPSDEMVKSIIIISDMEIDCCIDRQWTFYDQMRYKFEMNGYKIPQIIFWNVNSRHNVFHADAKRKGVQLVSGSSPTVFKQLIDSIGLTPIELVEKVILSDRYSPITIG